MKKRMLITGTTQGIGLRIFERLKDDYEIITVNRRPFSYGGADFENYICDLYDITETEALAVWLAGKEIDILINNAGGAEPVGFSSMETETLIKCTNLNYHAPVLLMRAVIEGMKRKGFGRIINISSIASKAPRPLLAHYGAAKGALERFSSSLAVAYSRTGVNINCICPGGVDTETSVRNRRQMAQLSGREEDFYNQNMADKNGLGRLVSPDEVVDLVEFLLSEKARSISGQVINICGTKEVR